MPRSALWFLAAAVSLALPGCSNECPGPELINGHPYAMVASPLNPVITNQEAFPAYSSPGNGPSVWTFFWGSSLFGPVTVDIDGQTFTGDGDWWATDCGNFTLGANGDYTGEDGSTHSFNFQGRFMFYDDRMEGNVYWGESWKNGKESGSYEAETLQLRGVGPVVQ